MALHSTIVYKHHMLIVVSFMKQWNSKNKYFDMYYSCYINISFNIRNIAWFEKDDILLLIKIHQKLAKIMFLMAGTSTPM